jgi:GntR family transcriptional regulator
MAYTSKYLELADAPAARIRRGECAPGDRFPTVNEPAGARSTTRVRVQPPHQVRANTGYQVEKDLVLRPEEERATAGVAELDSGVSLSTTYEDQVELDVIPAPPDVAGFLGLETGALVLRRTSTRRHERGAGADRSVSYVPHDLAGRNPQLFGLEREPWPGGALHRLHTVGIEVDRIEDRVTASMPTAAETEAQDVPREFRCYGRGKFRTPRPVRPWR